MTHENKHTPIETHTKMCLYKECQNNHLNANTTEILLHIPILSNLGNTRGSCDSNVLIVVQKMSKKDGQNLSKRLSMNMVENVNAAAKITHNFLRSITLTEVETFIKKKVSEDINYMNGLLKIDFQKTILDFFVLTAIVQEANTEFAHINNSAIAKARGQA